MDTGMFKDKFEVNVKSVYLRLPYTIDNKIHEIYIHELFHHY